MTRVMNLNLSLDLGGAEVYTHTWCRALAARGIAAGLMIHPEARFWSRFDLAGIELLTCTQPELDNTPGARLVGWDLHLTHTSLPGPWLADLHKRGRFIALAHHALTEQNQYAYYREANLVFAVSGHVLATCAAHAILPCYPTPLLGAAMAPGTGAGADIVRNPVYQWDARKLRDQVLARLAPLTRIGQASIAFTRKPGLTLGIVSRIANIKQFPELFTLLAPVIARHPGVNLEIFGAGLYSRVRALERALAPIRDRTRFWGWQADAVRVYRELDFLLTGLPEREALGLNVIEAQAAGLPVLAPKAPPFTETLIDGVGGFLYRDPREDNGTDFERILAGQLAGNPRPNPLADPRHLAKFSFDAFADRAQAAIAFGLGKLAVTPKHGVSPAHK